MGITIEPPGPADPLAPAGSIIVYTSTTSATALQTIAASASLPAGVYQVTVNSHPTGTLGTIDADNYQLLVGAAVIGTIVATNGGGALSNPTTVNVVVPAGGATISLQAIVAATAGAVYRVQLIITKVG